MRDKVHKAYDSRYFKAINAIDTRYEISCHKSVLSNYVCWTEYCPEF
jgi:hypothetical protein